MKRKLLHTALAGTLLITALPGLAQDQTRDQMRDQTRDQVRDQNQQIYGSQLMTPQERAEYRSRMRNARTYEERQRIRQEHHQQMQERARQRGVTLPPAPPARGYRGQGGGMGPGGGMGGGRGGGMGGGR